MLMMVAVRPMQAPKEVVSESETDRWMGEWKEEKRGSRSVSIEA